ncbi:MAG: beta-hydroxyacyl-ACP dehydratase [Bacteroidales bacterium]|jgi:3-hydroxyacyl-[acyl-carrier-protein] dehydratase|nr:beta-hydroxyacyl-ACP dehydratase [Bacteroidales bacterium]MDD3273459.1 beta-hydroxyacyl-ACP dehydratase [Bacteroidales bacterium]
MRFILVDRIEELKVASWAKGVKCISMTDEIFNNHFPGYPIMPGSLIMEGLAQLSGVLFEYSLITLGHNHKRPVLTLVNKMKFRRFAHPGDKLDYHCSVKLFYPDEYAVATVTAKCEDKIYAEGELLFGFADILDEKLIKISAEALESVLKNTIIVASDESHI